MAGSKNNPNARKSNVQKVHNGQAVKPVRYIGPHGKYMAAQYDNGDFVVDEKSSQPIPYSKLAA